MPLQCNIDSKGKLARLIWGIALVLIAIGLLIFWVIPVGGVIPWLITVAVFLAGAFAIFEARAGWCVARAMGIKTPM